MPLISAACLWEGSWAPSGRGNGPVWVPTIVHSSANAPPCSTKSPKYDPRTGHLPVETLVDRAPALEGAFGHDLDGVLGVQIHDRIEITLVVQLDVLLQELPVGAHRLLLSLFHTCFGT